MCIPSLLLITNLKTINIAIKNTIVTYLNNKRFFIIIINVRNYC